MSLKVDNHLRRFSPRVLYRVTTSYTFEKNQATLPRHLGQEPKSLGEARRRHSLPRPLNQNLHKTEGDFDDRSSLRFYVAENLRVRNQCNRGRTPPFRHLINASLETPLEIHTRATRRRRAPKVIATTFVFDYTKLVPFSGDKDERTANSGIIAIKLGEVNRCKMARGKHYFLWR